MNQRLSTCVERLAISVFEIPTDRAEQDGTLAWTKTTLVTVQASGAGLTSLGYTYADAATAKLIEATLAPQIVGHDALATEAAYARMRTACRNLGQDGITSMAISAVDLALWDLKARLLELPLSVLLGAGRTRVPVYGSGGFTTYDRETLQRQLSNWVAHGIGQVKIKVGSQPEQDLQRVREAREAIGESTGLFVDANGAHSIKQALRQAEGFARFNVTWFEEPVTSDDKHMRQQKVLNVLPQGHAWLLVEIGSHDAGEARARAEVLLAEVRKNPKGLVDTKLIWIGQSRATSGACAKPGSARPLSYPVSPTPGPVWKIQPCRQNAVAEYLGDLRALFDRYQYKASLYGHFGMGCVHCRISFELTSADGIAKYRRFMVEAARLICEKYGGSISGEHGDGQARGELLEDHVRGGPGAGISRVQGDLGSRRPDESGKIVDARPLDADLRLGADYDPARPKTHFSFASDQGSFANATLRCVGVGKCRRLRGEGEQDTMCPSFMVTRDERHSTRGRAHLLWEMLRSDKTPIHARFRDDNVKDALDLCLSCKGCKGDCPVNVDVATYKAEFLSHYYEGRVRPRCRYDSAARDSGLCFSILPRLVRTPGEG